VIDDLVEWIQHAAAKEAAAERRGQTPVCAGLAPA
jgi:hypothetical protein